MDTSTNFVICFDTSIYDNTQYNFKGQFYKIFKEFKKEKFPNLEIYINSIIYREVMTHLEEMGEKNNGVIEKFKKDVWNLELFDELQRVLDIDCLRETSIKQAKDEFNNFLSLFSVDINSLKGNLIHADNQNYDLGKVLDDYFNHRPPFENKNNKKNEFPDALIVQNISQRFKNHDNFIVVSSDNGFCKAVGQKIPKATMFTNYSECANYLNKHHENYDKVCMTIEKLESVIKKKIYQFVSDLTYDFVPNYYAEDLGIKVDVTNYDRKAYSELHELNEMMIQKFKLNDSPLVRILNIEDNGNTMAEIAYEAIFSILGREDSSYDLINENHKVKYIVDITVNIDTDEILDFRPQEIFLNKDSLIDRKIERDYFELKYNEYSPILYPKSESYEVICDLCSCENVFPSPKMYAFSRRTLEKGSGWDTFFELEKDEVCNICGQHFHIDIKIAVDMDLRIEEANIHCSGGKTDLTFDFI